MPQFSIEIAPVQGINYMFSIENHVIDEMLARLDLRQRHRRLIDLPEPAHGSELRLGARADRAAHRRHAGGLALPVKASSLSENRHQAHGIGRLLVKAHAAPDCVAAPRAAPGAGDGCALPRVSLAASLAALAAFLADMSLGESCSGAGAEGGGRVGCCELQAGGLTGDGKA